MFSPADLLEKGKAGYEQVFHTLWQTGTQAVDKFGAATGIDQEQVGLYLYFIILISFTHIS